MLIKAAPKWYLFKIDYPSTPYHPTVRMYPLYTIDPHPTAFPVAMQ